MSVGEHAQLSKLGDKESKDKESKFDKESKLDIESIDEDVLINGDEITDIASHAVGNVNKGFKKSNTSTAQKKEDNPFGTLNNAFFRPSFAVGVGTGPKKLSLIIEMEGGLQEEEDEDNDDERNSSMEGDDS
jgi:hypothetical protein